MPRTAHEVADAQRAIAIVRQFYTAAEPESAELDLRLWKLLKAGSPILRAEMADLLAHVTNGPRRTLRALAHDPDPEVAGPVLRHSPAISDVAIAEMARCKGDKHLEAMAGRGRLNEKIAGILTRRGGASVLKTLARNRTAALSADARHRLETRLKHHELASRRDGQRNRRPPDPLFADADWSHGAQLSSSFSAGK
jgi:uncharacterized protein (DUF2336 family)